MSQLRNGSTQKKQEKKNVRHEKELVRRRMEIPMIKRLIAAMNRSYHRFKKRRAARGYSPASYQRYIYHHSRSED